MLTFYRLLQDLQKIADEAQDGFIVFTLGSAIPVSSMPSNIVEMFVHVFARLPQRVFWKWEKTNIQEKLSENVKIVDWLPQQDLLGKNYTITADFYSSIYYC